MTSPRAAAAAWRSSNCSACFGVSKVRRFPPRPGRSTRQATPSRKKREWITRTVATLSPVTSAMRSGGDASKARIKTAWIRR